MNVKTERLHQWPSKIRETSNTVSRSRMRFLKTLAATVGLLGFLLVYFNHFTAPSLIAVCISGAFVLLLAVESERCFRIYRRNAGFKVYLDSFESNGELTTAPVDQLQFSSMTPYDRMAVIISAANCEAGQERRALSFQNLPAETVAEQEAAGARI